MFLKFQEQDEHWIPPYVEGQFDDADEGSEISNPDRPSTVPDADHNKIDQLIQKIETLIKQTQEALYDDNGLSNDPQQVQYRPENLKKCRLISYLHMYLTYI